MAAKDATCLFC